MVKICPISSKQINENISRMNALFTVVFSFAYFITSSNIILGIIFLDFLLRNLFEGRFNPIILVNRYITESVLLKINLINAGPKIFAARIGLILSGISLILSLFTLEHAVLVPVVILGFFSFLEGVFGICVACKLYPFVKGWNI